MHSKAPAQSQSLQLDERREQLVTFVESAVRSMPPGHPSALLMVARSPDSPVARAVLALSDTLGALRLGGKLVFACSEAMASGDVWQLSFDRAFAHEVRLAPDPRMLGAHEQLVIGDHALWYGDNMRRDPLKRDAYQSFESDVGTVIRARATFGRLWQSAVPLYGHGAGQAAPVTAGHEALVPEASRPLDVLPADVVATLTEWRPAIKH